MKKKILIVGLGIISLLVLLFRFKSLFIAALVNSRPITRYELARRLETQGGREVLDNLITEKLIMQEAAKNNIEVTRQEIDFEIQTLKQAYSQSGQDFELLLQTQGMTEKDLREQIELQIIMERILASDISVTDDEVLEYFTQNEALFPEGTQLEDVQENITDQLRNQKLNEKAQEWLTQLRSNANIQNFLY